MSLRVYTEHEMKGILGLGVGGETNFPVIRGTVLMVGRLYVEHRHKGFGFEKMRLAGEGSVTNVFAALLTDAMHKDVGALADLQNFRHHVSGTGSAAEAVGNDYDTIVGASSPVEGTSTEASTMVYQTAATIDYGATYTIKEHGVFESADMQILLDRTLLAILDSNVNVDSGDSIRFTYTLAITPGG